MRLLLGTVNLFGMHIFPLLTINAGTHFTYTQRDGGLSQPSDRLSQEQVLNLGPHMGRCTALPTELFQPIKLTSASTIIYYVRSILKIILQHVAIYNDTSFGQPFDHTSTLSSLTMDSCICMNLVHTMITWITTPSYMDANN